jgi:hypothetical protein
MQSLFAPEEDEMDASIAPMAKFLRRFGRSLSAGMATGESPFARAFAAAQDAPRQQRMRQIAEQVEMAKLGAIQAQEAQRYAQANRQQEIEAAKERREARVFSLLMGDNSSSPTAGNSGTPKPDDSPLAGMNPAQRAAVALDMQLNNGKNIPDWMMKRGTPDMQVTNGYAYDKNKLPPGYMPSMSVSQSGQATQVSIGPDGQPVVSVPRGALAALESIANTTEAAKARRDLVRAIDPSTGAETFATREQAVRAADGGAGRAPRPQGGRPQFRSTDAEMDQRAILNAELARVEQSIAKGGVDPASMNRLQSDRASIMNELGRVGGRSALPSASGPMQASLSPSQIAAAEAEKTRSIGLAKADVERDTARQSSFKQFGELTNQAGEARAILQNNLATASGAGQLVDKGLSFFGASTRGGDNAARLAQIGAYLTSSVPRFEGPQSNKDVDTYREMAGQVGNANIPASQRLAALDQAIKMHETVQNLQGRSKEEQGAQTRKAAGGLLDELPPANSSNKGKIAVEEATGKRFRSNGIQWVPL